MPARRVQLKKTREIFRLLWHMEVGVRMTARACKTSHSTVLEYRTRAEEAGLDWTQVEAMDDVRLEQELFPATASPPPRALPDWSELHLELKKPGLTLQLLWE